MDYYGKNNLQILKTISAASQRPVHNGFRLPTAQYR